MNTPQKSLETKITNILTNPSCRDFILVDAKDADMAFGLAAPGILSEPFAEDQTFRTMEFYREQILGIVEDGNIDIMLMSASTNAQLTIDWKIFKSSSVTPAVRMNDTTDIWLSAGTGSYSTQPPLPFSTCSVACSMRNAFLRCEWICRCCSSESASPGITKCAVRAVPFVLSPQTCISWTD